MFSALPAINIFYEELEHDRWLPFDRYPRKVVRRLVRGKTRPGGPMRVFLNLCAGLDLLGVSYRVNDFRHATRHPHEVVGIIGKPHLLDKIPWKNPILFGAAVYSHPFDDPDLPTRLPVQRILVPGEWMRQMCKPLWREKVAAWPVGIDTVKWSPAPIENKDIDILVYDKVMWEHERYETELITPARLALSSKGLNTTIIRYGYYREEEFESLLRRSKAMVFFCEHETQGIAYQQALSCNVPILAWDRGGYWQDPSYYPHKVKFSPVTSVPYWDERCGLKFHGLKEFPAMLEEFLDKQARQEFSPRDYILENLTLEKCAEQYVRFYEEVQGTS